MSPSLADLTAVWRELEERMRAAFSAEGIESSSLVLARTADMRYAGQEHTVNVPIPDGTLDDTGQAEIERRFHDLHEQLYTFRQPSPIEFVNFRLAGFATVSKPALRRLAANGRAESASTEA